MNRARRLRAAVGSAILFSPSATHGLRRPHATAHLRSSAPSTHHPCSAAWPPSMQTGARVHPRAFSGHLGERSGDRDGCDPLRRIMQALPGRNAGCRWGPGDRFGSEGIVVGRPTPTLRPRQDCRRGPVLATGRAGEADGRSRPASGLSAIDVDGRPANVAVPRRGSAEWIVRVQSAPCRLGSRPRPS